VSSDKNPLPGRYTYYRTLNAEDSRAWFSVWEKEQEERNGENSRRVVEQGPTNPVDDDCHNKDVGEDQATPQREREIEILITETEEREQNESN